jgi:hypothetical protein
MCVTRRFTEGRIESRQSESGCHILGALPNFFSVLSIMGSETYLVARRISRITRTVVFHHAIQGYFASRLDTSFFRL